MWFAEGRGVALDALAFDNNAGPDVGVANDPFLGDDGGRETPLS